MRAAFVLAVLLLAGCTVRPDPYTLHAGLASFDRSLLLDPNGSTVGGNGGDAYSPWQGMTGCSVELNVSVSIALCGTGFSILGPVLQVRQVNATVPMHWSDLLVGGGDGLAVRTSAGPLAVPLDGLQLSRVLEGPIRTQQTLELCHIGATQEKTIVGLQDMRPIGARAAWPTRLPACST